ncbi:uncharacterized protein K444DRAFT_616082 [Hyaloscypha bicolor E]|uniref:Uncharacterized protein n=1 Tax=Hyaloscypha bicolor E TaxID=1095630 RepID=A0A2J6SZT7_9HELO|nr:uncharacterized protein K444DRAFT_616082 [Hyaloscypha bicolor E]PMD56274.1 hypothetical protein K444DRAFT_616082 [Hyaloscypha bicolor E]
MTISLLPPWLSLYMHPSLASMRATSLSAVSTMRMAMSLPKPLKRIPQPHLHPHTHPKPAPKGPITTQPLPHQRRTTIQTRHRLLTMHPERKAHLIHLTHIPTFEPLTRARTRARTRLSDIP